MDWPHGYHEYGLSPREKSLLLSNRRQEATAREHERLNVLAGDEDAMSTGSEATVRPHRPHEQNSRRSPSLAKSCSLSPTASRKQHASPTGKIRIPVVGSIADEQIAAAKRIQTFYLTRKALYSIKSIRAQYDAFRHNFTFPTKLEFILVDAEQQVVSIECARHVLDSVPEHIDTSEAKLELPYKLASTNANVPLHLYTESLNRLLVALDGVECWGQNSVRDERTAFARQIEDEARSLERRVRAVWDSRHRQVSNDDCKSSNTTAEESTPAPSSM